MNEFGEDQISAAIRAVVDCRYKSFSSIVEAAGLDISEHLQNGDWRGVDFQRSNLRGYCFDGSDLRGTNLDQADLEGATFLGAKLDAAAIQIVRRNSWPTAKHKTFFNLVNRLEKIRIWALPASSGYYDGDWRINLTPTSPLHSLNCITPLSLADDSDIDARLHNIASKLAARQKFVVRDTPLLSPAIREYFAVQGWQVVLNTRMYVLDITNHIGEHRFEQDINRNVDAIHLLAEPQHRLESHEATKLIRRVPMNTLVIKSFPSPYICVSDSKTAGIISLKNLRKKNKSIDIPMTVLLDWAHLCGANLMWAEVSSKDQSGNRSLVSNGFAELYQCRYWTAPFRSGEW